MLREQIRNDIAKTINNLQWSRFLTKKAIDKSQIEVTRTSEAKFGDYSTNIALRAVTRDTKHATRNTHKSYQSPIEFANILADSLKSLPYCEKLEVAGPGFLNFFIKSEVWQKEIADVLKEGEKYGSSQLGKGKGARVEFVSANPTGPLHFGNARGGPIGDVLASVLEFCGYKVLREYYHNDVGEQVRKLGESVLNVAKGEKLENQEYKGEYVRELVNKFANEPGLKKFSKPGSKEFGKWAVDILLEEIKEDCRDIGINFDQFYSESDFLKSGQTKKVLEKVKKYLADKEGALWFAPRQRRGSPEAASDEFLKDRETVVVKSDGSFTYFANDISYHDLKFKDNPELVIDIFGANHHGHVPRLQAAVLALGYDVSKFKLILYQWVRFKRGSELVKMSKRAGTFVTVREVLDEVGRDALRFFILMHDPNTHIDFDLELAKKKSQENPVYYVQYAHARIASILAKSVHEPGLKISPKPGSGKTDYRLLTTNYELDLIKQIARLPELVEDIAASFAVHRLTGYAVDLADSFHRFYENCRVIGEQKNLTQARMALILATKTALINTFRLLGISAPERM